MECRHKFEPRYHEKWPKMESEDIMYVMRNEDLIVEGRINDCQEKIYVYDICVNCGKIVKDDIEVKND